MLCTMASEGASDENCGSKDDSAMPKTTRSTFSGSAAMADGASALSTNAKTAKRPQLAARRTRRGRRLRMDGPAWRFLAGPADGRRYNRIIATAIDRCKASPASYDQTPPPLPVAFDLKRIPMPFPIPAILSALRFSALAFAALVGFPAPAQMASL